VEVYRFLWLRPRHRPIAIRFKRHLTNCTLTVQELDGHTAEAPRTLSSTLVKPIVKPIDPAQWDRFISLMEDADYWELPRDAREMVLGGDLWLLEGYREGYAYEVNCHVPKVSSPNPAFYRACRFLLDLAGIEVPAPEVD
jgi:hypothetical protein